MAGFNDAILLDSEGKITEASAANLFLIQDEKIVTPVLNQNIFPGITRATIIDIANSFNIEVIERDIKPEELGNFQGAFLAATMMELKPLASIDPYAYDSVNHPLFKLLLKEFQAITHQ